MKTRDKVRMLGLYASHCCKDELLFDRNDRFSSCPRCQKFCRWELVEEVVSWLELDTIDDDLESAAA